jgi:hypothetical protein
VTDDGFAALHLTAFFSGHAQAARMLLEAGSDPNAVAANETGLRPIHSAAAAVKQRDRRPAPGAGRRRRCRPARRVRAAPLRRR